MKFQRILFCLVLLHTTTVMAEDIRNGQFSKGLKSWLIERSGANAIQAKDSSPYCRFEDTGVLIDVASVAETMAEPPANPAAIRLVQYLSDLEEGVDYTLSFEVKIPDGEKATYALGAGFQSGPNKGNVGGGIPLTELTGTGEWESVQMAFRWEPEGVLAASQDGSLGSVTLQYRIGNLTEFGLRNVSLER